MYKIAKKIDLIAKDIIGQRKARKLRFLTQKIISIPFSSNLKLLSQIHRSDKGSPHNYTKLYSSIFRTLQKERITLLEIGIGGYRSELDGGNSLRMWQSYFPRARILGLDIYNKEFHQTARIKTIQGSQEDTNLLEHIVEKYGQPDIIIDDGSHYSPHIVKSFETLFPLLKMNGYYCIEDLHTSYWPSGFGGHLWGGSQNIENPNTSMHIVKRALDCIHAEDMLKVPNELLGSKFPISEVHCMRGVAIIKKGLPDPKKISQWKNYTNSSKSSENLGSNGNA
jgi:hypothetical protein